MAFTDLTTTKKGEIGERVVDNFLEQQNYFIVRPKEGKPHAIDRFCMSSNNQVIAVEMKTKPSRDYYPDTGFDTVDFETYQKMNIPVLIAFVDEGSGSVYGEFLSNLSKARKVAHNGRELQYPKREGSVIYFPLESMRLIGNIKKFYITKIKRHTSSNYEGNGSAGDMQMETLNLIIDQNNEI